MGVLTDHSHQPRHNSLYDLSHHACKYIIVITVNEPSPLAPLTPALGAGGVGGVGCFLLVPIIIRARAAAGATAAWLSHRRAGTYTDASPYMDSLTEKHLAHLAHDLRLCEISQPLGCKVTKKIKKSIWGEY